MRCVCYSYKNVNYYKFKTYFLRNLETTRMPGMS